MINANELGIDVLDFLWDILGYEFIIEDGRITQVIQ